MQPGQLQQIAELHRAINPSPWSVKQWETCCDTAHYRNWVAFDPGSGRVVAFSCFLCLGPDIELLNIGVAQKFQGVGIGEDFLQACLLLVPETSERCFLEVRRSNIPAINLYQKLQFRQVGERKDYYRLTSGLIEDALVFRKDLIKN